MLLWVESNGGFDFHISEKSIDLTVCIYNLYTISDLISIDLVLFSMWVSFPTWKFQGNVRQVKASFNQKQPEEEEKNLLKTYCFAWCFGCSMLFQFSILNWFFDQKQFSIQKEKVKNEKSPEATKSIWSNFKGKSSSEYWWKRCFY